MKSYFSRTRGFSLCCKRNVNASQVLRYIRVISGTVLGSTMVCREQWSRDQCGVSWISEGDILCKFISHCEHAPQLLNGTVCTTALFTLSLKKSSRLLTCILPRYPLHRPAISFSPHPSPLRLSWPSKMHKNGFDARACVCVLACTHAHTHK